MKTFLVILVIALLGWGAWWFFGSGHSYVFSGSTSPSARNVSARLGVVAGTSTVSSNMITNVTNDVMAQAEQTFNDAASGTTAALTNVETSTANAAKNTIDNIFEGAVSDGENFLGIATGTTANDNATVNGTSGGGSWYQNNGGAISVFMGPVVKVGQPINLVMDESLFSEQNTGKIDVYANWEDGTEEHQTLYATGTNENDFLTHAFAMAGTYKPLFTFEANSSTIQYTMIISVQP
jgi:hypothetical protein